MVLDLELSVLNFTHRGKFDFIYADPPYNTGARDWKYNNDYVDSTDSFRHSKWLNFMKSRLTIAKSLLKNDLNISGALGEMFIWINKIFKDLDSNNISHKGKIL